MVAPVSIAEFDAVPVTDAAAELLPCCASRRWIGRIVSGRPYRSFELLAAASDAVLAQLRWSDIEEALAAHPRIGERRLTDAWSREEQAGAARADAEVERALREGNRAYEQRFGHVFLICATGLSAAQMLDALRARLGNSTDLEQAVVRVELAKIVRLRLAKAFR